MLKFQTKSISWRCVFSSSCFFLTLPYGFFRGSTFGLLHINHTLNSGTHYWCLRCILENCLWLNEARKRKNWTPIKCQSDLCRNRMAWRWSISTCDGNLFSSLTRSRKLSSIFLCGFTRHFNASSQPFSMREISAQNIRTGMK